MATSPAEPPRATSTAPRQTRESPTGGRLRGDEADLFRAHHQQLLRQVTGHLRGERDIAEEACGLAWLQLLRRQPERGDALPGWLFTVAKHEAYRLLRLRQREQPNDSGEHRPSQAGDPFDQLARAQLLALIGKLPARQRLALGLFVRGYTYRDICAATGKTYTWVNRHISEGRMRIRQLARDLDS